MQQLINGDYNSLAKSASRAKFSFTTIFRVLTTSLMAVMVGHGKT